MSEDAGNATCGIDAQRRDLINLKSPERTMRGENEDREERKRGRERERERGGEGREGEREVFSGPSSAWGVFEDGLGIEKEMGSVVQKY